MCGITGIFAFNQVGAFYMINLGKSMETLGKRGPDQRGSFIEDFLALGHRRLSILDLSIQGKQPMEDPSGRYVIVFNGEIFNFRQVRTQLEHQGIVFTTETDTEVLLQLYIRKKEACLKELIGFFSFAIYDKEEKLLFIARDRFGIKPLLYYSDEDKFIFASEMKALTAYNIPKEIDPASLRQYLHFNYIPGPNSIFRKVHKLEPGHYLKIKKNQVEKQCYYQLESHINPFRGSYQEAIRELEKRLEESVQLRMISDAPLGTFLSGGIDSSIITALAARQTDKLSTFTIGFRDEKFFDETEYARLVAKKYNTDHHVFSLSNKELYENFQEVLDYIDEPFADSSSLAMYILSKKTASTVKVALSGDGADELFGGYNKHRAEFILRNPDSLTRFLLSVSPVFRLFGESRSGKFSNLVRQINKLSKGNKYTTRERYYRWAGFQDEEHLDTLLSASASQDYLTRKEQILKYFTNEGFSSVFRTDLDLVLQNDMLQKVDLMSMANSLEVRVPFLDHRVVEFAFSLPDTWKVTKNAGKQIVRDTFEALLPAELLTRKKKGFEVPLLKWLRTEMADTIKNDLLKEDFIRQQEIFNYDEIKMLLSKLNSLNPGDTHAKIWALVVFQYWYKKYLS